MHYYDDNQRASCALLGRVMLAAMSFPDIYNLSSHTRHTCAYAMACSRALGFSMVF